MAFLDLAGVGFTYPGWPPVVRGVDWSLGEGEFHGLVGRSGSGKTTLLKLAAGLLQPDTGQIALQGRRGIAPGPDLGFVFQSPTLLDWQRVIDNVLLPVSLMQRPTPRHVEHAEGLLAQLGLSTHARHYPRQLSGGQQSRVALARALVLEPRLLLLDEPFAALDAITREELQVDLLRMCALRRTTVLFVTHDIGEAVFLGDRVSVLGGGRLMQSLAVPPDAARDTPAFGACCAALRAALGLTGVEA